MEQKPGIQTTEFWLTSATSVTSAIVFSTGSETLKIVALACQTLVVLGYIAARALAKWGV